MRFLSVLDGTLSVLSGGQLVVFGFGAAMSESVPSLGGSGVVG